MALHIEDAEVERLAAEVARLAHESETEAVRRALAERKEKLEQSPSTPKPKRSSREFFEREGWPRIPPDVLGKSITKEEQEKILGFGPEGFQALVPGHFDGRRLPFARARIRSHTRSS